MSPQARAALRKTHQASYVQQSWTPHPFLNESIRALLAQCGPCLCLARLCWVEETCTRCAHTCIEEVSVRLEYSQATRPHVSHESTHTQRGRMYRMRAYIRVGKQWGYVYIRMYSSMHLWAHLEYLEYACKHMQAESGRSFRLRTQARSYLELSSSDCHTQAWRESKTWSSLHTRQDKFQIAISTSFWTIKPKSVGEKNMFHITNSLTVFVYWLNPNF